MMIILPLDLHQLLPSTKCTYCQKYSTYPIIAYHSQLLHTFVLLSAKIPGNFVFSGSSEWMTVLANSEIHHVPSSSVPQRPNRSLVAAEVGEARRRRHRLWADSSDRRDRARSCSWCRTCTRPSRSLCTSLGIEGDGRLKFELERGDYSELSSDIWYSWNSSPRRIIVEEKYNHSQVRIPESWERVSRIEIHCWWFMEYVPSRDNEMDKLLRSIRMILLASSERL